MIEEDTLLLKSIKEWQEHCQRQRARVIERPCPPLPDRRMARALTGLRRTGKTQSAFHMLSGYPNSEVFYYNFEDPFFVEHNEVKYLSRLLDLAESHSKSPLQVLILDEIHNVDGWERWIRKLIDFQKYKIIITGSSAKLLSSELSTSLTGRCLESKIWPLSITEVFDFRKESTLNSDSIMRLFVEYQNWGALPEIVLTKDSELKEKILKQYLSDILNKDVVSRHEIRNKRALDQILVYLLTNISSLHSYGALKKAFGINEETAHSYIEALKSAFLFFEVDIFSQNLKVQSRNPRKIYCIDVGFCKVGSRTLHDNSSRILENNVFLQLMRANKEVYYYRNEAKHEVDFVICKNYQPEGLVQACYDVSDSKTFDRETRSLLAAAREFGLKGATIVTHNQTNTIELEGVEIRCVSFYEWVKGMSISY